MAKKLPIPLRVLAQSVSLLALVLFAVALLGLRWFVAGPSAVGLGLAVGAGVACLVIVAAMIYLHYPSPRQSPRQRSHPHSC
jgi:multisubunit Na+/H+ antiporter MnhB subunit